MLLNLFDARQTKKLARTLEKEFAARGVQLAHGQALNMLARLAGKGDWKDVVRSRSPEVLDAQLMSVELEHIRANEGNDYGEEAALLVRNGFQLRYSANDKEPCDYVRVCDPLGREIAYWVSDEWRDDPQMVMGAILGALAQGRPLAPAKDGLRETASTVERSAAVQPSEPRIQQRNRQEPSPFTAERNGGFVHERSEAKRLNCMDIQLNTGSRLLTQWRSARANRARPARRSILARCRCRWAPSRAPSARS